MFFKTVFKTTFGLSNVLKITFSALNHVNDNNNNNNHVIILAVIILF